MNPAITTPASEYSANVDMYSCYDEYTFYYRVDISIKLWGAFARTEGAQQEQYQKLGVSLLLGSARSRGNC